MNYAVVETCGVEVTLLYEDNESKLGGMCGGGQQRWTWHLKKAWQGVQSACLPLASEDSALRS